jgi:hypothetical protein
MTSGVVPAEEVSQMEHEGGSERQPGQGPAERHEPDTRFLDLEASKVLFEAACGAARAALREALAERARAHLSERIGQRIDALAALAVDELLADLDANLEIESRIEERRRRAEDRAERLRLLLAPEDEQG